ncbi:hypothetical protein ACMZOO_03130 [Catenovulum sp. SX2]|uniref:hypothetical protein n=1 Tax=Catenovulum sp. SX2 TaxID=3398614 RepID=UPI003F86F48B
MSPKTPLNVDEIHKLAESIKTIENFAENRNFNSSLFNVSLSSGKPQTPDKSEKIKPNFNIMLICSFLVMFISLGIYLFVELSTKQQTFSLVVTILAAGFAILGTHLKYKNAGATAIIGFCLVAIITIGYEIFTPKEVAEKAEKMLPGK